MESLTIPKLEAAKRQLETAIALFFDHGDPVSIHTLAVQRYGGRLRGRCLSSPPRAVLCRALFLPLPLWRDSRAARFRRWW